MTPMSQVVPHLYIKCIINVDIKLYEVPEENKKITHT